MSVVQFLKSEGYITLSVLTKYIEKKWPGQEITINSDDITKVWIVVNAPTSIPDNDIKEMQAESNRVVREVAQSQSAS
ncbi:Protein of unknown function [Pyronema omphalodes CBS 100304]|uniref:Uncharacterized protein n=1 Tax=Pyronema omphalodes (strain CBS 100304) TaxID=1076935 RepID=U4LHA1_PYROM|nr:Protein of unknown function [Pyronema omphalodes CBS 100304]